jgi:hypothetical protein
VAIDCETRDPDLKTLGPGVRRKGSSYGPREQGSYAREFYTTVKTANYTAAANEGVQTDTSGGAFTVTLPATPAVGDQVFVTDSAGSWATNNLTVGRNGSTIDGLAEDLTCNISSVSVQFIYNGTTWDVFAQAGGSGGAADINTQTTGTLNVSRGGTGVTASTGTTAVVLSNSPTLVTPTLGAASAASITAALGSVSAPSYTFTGDTNTGIYSPAADTLAFVEGGVEALRLLSTGGITSPDLVDAVGYKGLPQNSQTASYTLALSDMGKMVNTTTGGVVIPANGSVAFPIGAAISIFNNSGSNQTISITSDTLRLAGTATTGSRTLAQYGLATCVKVAATTWAISGAGVT